MKFVCIKVVEPGKNWFLAITRNKYVPNFDGVVYSDMPDLNRSLEVSKILAEKFEFFQEKFRKAGYGELVRDQLYWIGDSYQENGSWYQRCIKLPTQETVGIKESSNRYGILYRMPILVFDDWNLM